MDTYGQRNSTMIKWILALIMLLAFGALLALVVWGSTVAIDDTIYNFFAAYRDPFVTSVAKTVTYSANTPILAGLCVIFIILPTRMKFGFPLAFSTGLAVLLHFALKSFIERPRPDDANWLITASGFSFPSGHANAGIVFYIFAMILLRRALILRGHRGPAWLITFLFPLFVILIGISRIYLGVHYPSDVLAGWLLGGFLLILFETLYDFFWPSKYRITYDAPNWEIMHKRRPWRKPINKEAELIDFPKSRSPWRHAKKDRTTLAKEAQARKTAELRDADAGEHSS